jgi:hypothetical protein
MKINISESKITALFDAIDFTVSPYLEEVNGDEGIAEFKENYPWLYELCMTYDDILKECPDDIKMNYEFYGL